MLISLTAELPTLAQLIQMLLHHETLDVPCSHSLRRLLINRARRWVELAALPEYIGSEDSLELDELDPSIRTQLDLVCDELVTQALRVVDQMELIAVVPIDERGTTVVLLTQNGLKESQS
jgi:hypothetical protein